jgi:hypothetical protein
MKLGGFGGDEPPTNTRLGRLRYEDRATARKKARALGISGSHSHQMRGKTIYMPGTNHKTLNKALRERGMRPTPVPGANSDGGGESGGMLGDMLTGGSDDTSSGSAGFGDRELGLDAYDLPDPGLDTSDDDDDDNGGGLYG